MFKNQNFYYFKISKIRISSDWVVVRCIFKQILKFSTVLSQVHVCLDSFSRWPFSKETGSRLDFYKRESEILGEATFSNFLMFIEFPSLQPKRCNHFCLKNSPVIHQIILFQTQKWAKIRKKGKQVNVSLNKLKMMISSGHGDIFNRN